MRGRFTILGYIMAAAAGIPLGFVVGGILNSLFNFRFGIFAPFVCPFVCVGLLYWYDLNRGTRRR